MTIVTLKNSFETNICIICFKCRNRTRSSTIPNFFLITYILRKLIPLFLNFYPIFLYFIQNCASTFNYTPMRQNQIAYRFTAVSLVFRFYTFIHNFKNVNFSLIIQFFQIRWKFRSIIFFIFTKMAHFIFIIWGQSRFAKINTRWKIALVDLPILRLNKKFHFRKIAPIFYKLQFIHNITFLRTLWKKFRSSIINIYLKSVIIISIPILLIIH